MADDTDSLAGDDAVQRALGGATDFAAIAAAVKRLVPRRKKVRRRALFPRPQRRPR